MAIKWKYKTSLNYAVDNLYDDGTLIASLIMTSYDSYELRILVGPERYPYSIEHDVECKDKRIKLQKVLPSESRKKASEKLSKLFYKYAEFYKDMSKAVDIKNDCLHTRCIISVPKTFKCESEMHKIFVNGFDCGYLDENEKGESYFAMHWPFIITDKSEYITYEAYDMPSAMEYLKRKTFPNFVQYFKTIARVCDKYTKRSED